MQNCAIRRDILDWRSFFAPTSALFTVERPIYACLPPDDCQIEIELYRNGMI